MNPFKGMGDLMQQAQKMREDFQRVQDEASKKTIEVTAGGGMVKIRINGRQEISAITIEPSLIAKNDAVMLQDVVRSAVNAAIKASQDMVGDEIKKFTETLGPLANLMKGLG